MCTISIRIEKFLKLSHIIIKEGLIFNFLKNDFNILKLNLVNKFILLIDRDF